MTISNITKIAAITAGANDGAKQTPVYTCASECPTVKEMVASQDVSTRTDYLMEVAAYWDRGYMGARAETMIALTRGD